MDDYSNDSTDTQVLYFHSQSPPPELGYEKMNGTDQMVEDTEPLDDAVSLDDSSDGTPLVTLDFDSQVVEDSECAEDGLRPLEITEYDKEVVLDSEDEGNSVQQCGTEALIVDESPNVGRDYSRKVARDQEFTELNYTGSQEPRESSQANALEFVDNYLLLNNVDSFRGTTPINIVRKKVSPVSRIKGCQSLAKQLKTRSSGGENGAFNWVDNDYCGGIDFLSKKVAVSPSLDLRPAVDSRKEMSRYNLASELNVENDSVKNSNEVLNKIQLGKDSDAYSIEESASHVFDVGFGTQMAAEAMAALSHSCNCTNNVCECFQNPSQGVAKSEIGLKNSCLQKGMFSDLEDIKEMSKQRESYAYANSSWGYSSYLELDTEFEIPTKRKRSNISAKRLNNEFSAGIPVNKIKEDVTGKLNKKEGEAGSVKLGETINDTVKSGIITYKRKKRSLCAKPSQVLSGRGNCTKGESFAQWKTGSETKKESDSPAKRNNAIMEGSLITYKRKRIVRVDKVLDAEGKLTKLCCNSPDVLKNNEQTQQPCSLEVPSLANSLNYNGWSFRKGKRMPRRRRIHSNGANNMSTNDGIEGEEKPCYEILPKSSLSKELLRLGIPDSKPGLKFKDLRKKMNTSDVKVLFSQHLDDDIIRQQKKIIARLGIAIASCSMDATHFIADHFVRTRNMLEAIALGKPVVTHLWLESCGQASCLIDEKNFILRDAKKEKKLGFSMAASLARATHHSLLKGMSVLITPNVKPDEGMIASLVKAVHGQVMENCQMSGQKIPDDLLILSCEEDYALCVPYIDNAVYSSELLLNGIVIQKLEYERHRLFTNQAKRNKRSSTR
ncbi:uncharacterized protein LOC126688307 isoform X2 [Mercurialis annua]|uniref:uncharacterized protein LOC126688307 isoform X2 n=1 Tax=Mercurialis annua TaxID=3986 RepID=UPI0024AD6ADB|nr:uncharacterized protein LOC126688307 isoform X2 [Mercurialis annua]